MNSDTSAWLTEILISLGIFAAFVVAGKALIFIIDRFVRKLTENTATQLDDMLLAVVEKPSYYLIILWGAYISFHRLKLEFGDRVFDVADKAVFVIAVALFVKLVYDVINAMLEWYALSIAEKGREDIGKSVIPLLKKLVKIFVIISGLIVVLDHFSYNISSLIAALGVSSLAIGLAAKETLSNMIAGFVIVVDRPFRLGDRIESDGKVGDVMEMGLRSTKIRTLDNNILIIPNTKLVDNVVNNYAYPENGQTHTMKVGVEYGCDVAKVKRVLLDVVGGVPEILKDPPPGVFFTEHGDFALVFQVFYRVPEYTLKWAVLDKINTAINRRFAEEGINMAYPTRTLHIRKDEGTPAAGMAATH